MSKLHGLILEDIAAQLSDRELITFMFSSKDAFAATLHMLSKVQKVFYGRMKDTQEPCLEFAVRNSVSCYMFNITYIYIPVLESISMHC